MKNISIIALAAVLVCSTAYAGYIESAETKKILADYPKSQEEVAKLDQRVKDLDQHQTLLIAGLAFAVVGIGVAYGVGFASGVKARASLKD